jgi:hypothetical protein
LRRVSQTTNMKCVNGSTAPIDSKTLYNNRESVELGVLIQNSVTNRNQKQVAERHANNFGRDISFIICGNCLWCASLLAARAPNEHRCPNCSENILESIPIALTEKFAVIHDQKRRMNLEFSPSAK